MYPFTHLIYASVAALFGFQTGLISVFGAVVLVLLSVLVDIDHLICFNNKNKDWNLKRCWNYCIASDLTQEDMIFHKRKFVIPALLISIFLYLIWSSIGYVFLAGLAVHYVLDFVHFHMIYRKQTHLGLKIFGLKTPLHIYELVADATGLGLLIALIL